MKSSVAFLCVLSLANLNGIALAQPTTAPTSAAAPAVEHLTATVIAVQGLVQYRTGEDQPWKRANAGLVLNEGAEFRTGPRSAVQFKIPPEQVITLDRLGVIKVLQAVKDSQLYKTDVGMKYGRTRYDIEAAGVEHESTIRSPDGTLAVRDTHFAVDNERPFPMEAYRLSGTVEYITAKRVLTLGGPGAAPGKVKAVGDQTPSQASLQEAVVDPSAQMARTSNEAQLVANLLSRGDPFSITEGKGIPIVRGGTPPTDAQLIKSLPGPLDFVLRWSGNANLDLQINSQATRTGETLYPATGVNRSRSGGYIPFDHQGGPHGGIELAYWSKAFPNGPYDIVVNSISGVPVNFTMNVFVRGQLTPILDFSTGQSITRWKGQIKPGTVALGTTNIGPSIAPMAIPSARVAAVSRR